MLNDDFKTTYEKMLENILIKLNISFTNQMKEQFCTYYNFLIEYNNRVNLTALTEISDVYIKHFADSAMGAKYIKYGAEVCDIGTGAGFPGVVLKIIRPDIRLVLVDSLNKRIEFLNKLLEKLNINDVLVLHNRAEDNAFKTKFLNGFDIVVSRAVARMNTLCEYCLPYVKPGGDFVAYKSIEAHNEIIEAKNAISVLGGQFVKIDQISLNNTKRNFVIIKKIKPSSNKYPRRQNKPRLKPL